MEVIWTAAASDDYIKTEAAKVASLDTTLQLLQVFPEMGARVPYSSRLRRLLVGSQRHFGLYYSISGKRIIVVAL